MKYFLINLFVVLSFLGLLFTMYLWFDYVKKTESEVVDYRYPPHRIKGKIKIGIIGDSWASGQKIDAFLRDALMAKGIESVIISSGQRGAKSRRIYKNLFEPADNSFSSNHMLFGKPLDLCVVLAGVNDSATYVGSDFFAHHLKQITQALITRGITPFIVEVPEYGIEEIDSKTIQGKVRRRLMRLVHHGGRLDVISEYRLAAAKMLQESFDQEEYVYLSFGAVSIDYKKNLDLYKKDLVHLTQKGNKKLAQTIADSIEDWSRN